MYSYNGDYMGEELGCGLLSQFPPFHYISNFSVLSKYALAIEYHVYIWQLSCGVALVKYKCDSNNVITTFVRSKILLTEKLMNGSLVTPTPGLLHAEQQVLTCHS